MRITKWLIAKPETKKAPIKELFGVYSKKEKKIGMNKPIILRLPSLS